MRDLLIKRMVRSVLREIVVTVFYVLELEYGCMCDTKLQAEKSISKLVATFQSKFVNTI